MKPYVSVFTRQHIVLNTFLFLVILSLILPISSMGGNESNVGDELISLTVKDEPLGDVLYKVSMATGYDISLDNKWQNYRVTASLEEVSLHKGLKRILRNLNSAIIYVSSKKIKIIIYDKTRSEEASMGTSVDKSFNRAPVPEGRLYRPSGDRPPISQAVEKEDDSGSGEELSDNPVISDSEGTNEDIEEKSSEESSGNDNKTESKNE